MNIMLCAACVLRTECIAPEASALCLRAHVCSYLKYLKYLKYKHRRRRPGESGLRACLGKGFVGVRRRVFAPMCLCVCGSVGLWVYLPNSSKPPPMLEFSE